MAIGSSQTRRDAREILNTAAAMLHPVERTVGSRQQFFWRVAVVGESCCAGAGGETRHLYLRSHFLVNAANDAARNIRSSFGKHNCELVATIARCGVDRPAVVAQNLA